MFVYKYCGLNPKPLDVSIHRYYSLAAQRAKPAGRKIKKKAGSDDEGDSDASSDSEADMGALPAGAANLSQGLGLGHTWVRSPLAPPI